jgi:hypothetical protein
MPGVDKKNALCLVYVGVLNFESITRLTRFRISLDFHSFAVSLASTTSETRNQMGEICQSQGHPTQ